MKTHDEPAHYVEYVKTPKTPTIQPQSNEYKFQKHQHCEESFEQMQKSVTEGYLQTPSRYEIDEKLKVILDTRQSTDYVSALNRLRHLLVFQRGVLGL